MSEHVEPASSPPKLLGGWGFKLRLGGASILFLTVGALLAPAVGPTTLTTPAEGPAPLLEEQAQQRAIPLPFRGVSAVAALVRAHGVTIAAPGPAAPPVWSDYGAAPPPASPAGFGIFVSRSLVLTHAGALAGRSDVAVSTADGRAFTATLAAYDTATDLALLSVRDAPASPVSIAKAPMEAGALGAGVGQHGGRDVVVPVFFAGLNGERYALGEGAGLGGPGLPIFNLDGELVAINGSPAAGAHAIAAGPATARLLAQSANPTRPGTLGIVVQEIPPVLRPRLGAEGVLIAHVVAGGPADRAGIAVGEVLRAVDAVAVAGADVFASGRGPLVAGVPAVLHLDRLGRRVSVKVTPQSAYEVAALARRAPPGPAGGVPAGELLSSAVLSEAGLPPDALVERIDGRRVISAEQARRDLRRARRPLSLLLFHHGQWFFAGIENGP